MQPTVNFNAHLPDQLVLVGGQPVVQHDVRPIAVLPEAEVEDARVLVLLRAPITAFSTATTLRSAHQQLIIGSNRMYCTCTVHLAVLLVARDHALEQLLHHRQRRHRRQQPAVTYTHQAHEHNTVFSVQYEIRLFAGWLIHLYYRLRSVQSRPRRRPRL